MVEDHRSHEEGRGDQAEAGQQLYNAEAKEGAGGGVAEGCERSAKGYLSYKVTSWTQHMLFCH